MKKARLVAELAENFGRASIALLSEYKGVKAGESDDMRRRIRAVNGEFRVAKNTLVRLAIKDTSFARARSPVGRPGGLILSYADPVELAKTVSSLKELGEKFKIRGGVLDGKPISAAEVESLRVAAAARSYLCAIAGTVAGSATQLVRLLNEPGTLVARLVDRYRRKREAEAPAVEAPVAEAPAEASAADASPTEAPQS